MSGRAVAFVFCRRCAKQVPEGESPASYARLSVGVTADGRLEVWCLRHDSEVVTLLEIPDPEEIECEHPDHIFNPAPFLGER